MTATTHAWLALLLSLSATDALALDQLMHRAVTKETCEAAGLPRLFCAGVGEASQNVDGHEWDDPAAHAQAKAEDDLCGGAQATLARLHQIGAHLRPLIQRIAIAPDDALRRDTVEQLASELGRAMHTVQDLCAHEGMTNTQHAWFSVADLCTGSTSSPDLVTAAVDCAGDRSREVFAAFAAELEVNDIHPAEDFADISVYEGRLLPTQPQLCEYLLLAEDFDGVDRRWRLEVMQPITFDALLAGVREQPSPTLDCAGLQAEGTDVDVSKGAAWCPQAEATCTGQKGCGCGAAELGGSWFLALMILGRFATRRQRTLRG